LVVHLFVSVIVGCWLVEVQFKLDGVGWSW